MWGNTLLQALRAIRRNLMRSVLTTLGIVIGVAAVVTMVTVGNGATHAVKSQIESLGSNLLMIRPGQRMSFGGGGGGGAAPFKLADVQAIEGQVSGIAAVAPEVRAAVTVVADGKNWGTTITGTTNAYFATNNWRLAAGRMFEPAEAEAGAPVCVIGATVARELFGRNDPVGRAIRVKQFSCEVIGVLAGKGQAAMGADQDDTIVLPVATAQRRVTGSTRVNTILVSMKAESSPERVKASLTDLLRERRKLNRGDENNFNILDTQQVAETLSGTTRLLTSLLGAVAAVSLLVGGIGIMNIMLVSVTERTREIGLRLAIGAFEREVLAQFLIEAVVLAALGGLAGLILATAASVGIAQLMGVPFLFNPGINLLAFVFSAAIGVIFGFVPARRAARLDPIEALRHE
jgi:putative ABC transport system permease protein